MAQHLMNDLQLFEEGATVQYKKPERSNSVFSIDDSLICARCR
jgi:hypothetical protein